MAWSRAAILTGVVTGGVARAQPAPAPAHTPVRSTDASSAQPIEDDPQDGNDLSMRAPRPRFQARWRLSPPDPFTPHVAPDGTVGFDDHRVTDGAMAVEQPLAPSSFGPFDPSGTSDRTAPPLTAPLFTMGFRFDLTDIAMRRRGEDPYRREKQKFLARTFEARFAMAEAARKRRLWRALAELPDELARLWSDPTKSEATKRAALEQLWREANSDERGPNGKPAGQEAREIIERFMTELNAKMPAPSR